MIQLDDQDEVVVVRYLVKETTEEELIDKVSHEVTKTKEELGNIVRNVTKKLRECGALVE